MRCWKHARDTGHVSTVPVYCVPVYYPTCLGSKGLKRRSYARVRSTVPVYALLNVGSGLLSKRDKVRTGLCGNVRNCGVPLPQKGPMEVEKGRRPQPRRRPGPVAGLRSSCHASRPSRSLPTSHRHLPTAHWGSGPRTSYPSKQRHPTSRGPVRRQHRPNRCWNLRG
jgi:hypothetical protein